MSANWASTGSTESTGVFGQLSADDVWQVILVDDDVAYIHLCQRYLSSDKRHCYEVTKAESGAEAYELCKTGKYDCLVIDYSLPDMTGTALIEDLQSEMHDEMPPASVLTGRGGEDVAAAALRSGASDYLAKRGATAEGICRAITNAVEKGQLRKLVHDRRAELRGAYRELQHRNEEIQKFYHNVAHEVKTPLTAIREFIALISDEVTGPVSDEQQELLGFALESCDQINQHFNCLVDMTRLGSGKQNLFYSTAKVGDLCKRSVASVASAASAKDISIQQQVDCRDLVIEVDANRMVQVVTNLLANAIKYSEVGDQVELSVTVDGAERVAFSISDNGRGIGAEDQQRIFDRLYQVQDGSDCTMGAGLGLGLTLSRDLIEMHNGTIEVESELGRGSRFTFWVPLQPSDLREPPVLQSTVSETMELV